MLELFLLLAGPVMSVLQKCYELLSCVREYVIAQKEAKIEL